MNRDKFDFDKSAKLGLNKRVQKKYQDKDSVSEFSCVHSIEEAIKVFRNIVDHKLESRVQVEERPIISSEHVPGKAVEYNATGLPRIVLVVREWDNRPGFTVHLAGTKRFSVKEKKTILKSPLLDSYICNKKQVETIPHQGPLFQDPNDPFSFKVEAIEEIAEFFLSCIPKQFKKDELKESVTTLGLGKKVQKKHESTDSIDNVSDVVFDKAQDFIDVMRSRITNKDLRLTFDWGYKGSESKTIYYTIYYGEGAFELGQICIQTECINWPNNFSLKFYVWTDGDESSKTIGLMKNVWYEPINTLYSTGPEKYGELSLAEAVNAAKFIMKMFEETKDTYAYVPEAIEESSLGLNKRVQKIHDTRDAVSEVDPLLDFNSFFNVLKDFLKNKIKEHEDTRINDLFEELSKQKYAADNKDMIEIKLKMGFDFDSERITVNLYFDEDSNFIKNIWSFASFLGEPYPWDIEEKFSSEFLTDRSTPLVKRGLILSASSASALADAIIEQSLAYLDSYDEMVVSSSVHESANLGLSRRVTKNYEDRDTLDAVNDVELGEDEFMKIAEETFLKIPGIAVFDGPKVNLYSDEKYKYVSIFAEDNLDSATRTTTKNGNNLGISNPIYLTIRKRQDGDNKGFNLYFLENTNTDKAMSSTYQLFGVGDIGSSNVIILSKYFKDSKYIFDLTVSNIVKAADWLRDFIINAFPGEINETALGLNSKVSNKFKSEHSATKEIEEMNMMSIDEFESYFIEMCSALTFPDFKELRIKVDSTHLEMNELSLKFVATTGHEKYHKRFNGKLDWFVDEDTGATLFCFWIDNNLYSTDSEYNTKKFGTSKKFVEKYFLPTYKNLKECIDFIEEYINKNIKTIKKTFIDDASLDETMSLGLSKKVQDKHEARKEEAIENISILDPENFFEVAENVISEMLPDYILSNYYNEKFYIDDPFGIRQGPFVKCRVANFSKSTKMAFALVIDLDNKKFVLWKYDFEVAPYPRENNLASIKKKILSPEAKELSISELRDELSDLVETIDESISGLGLASKAKKKHSEKDSVTAFSELDEGSFLDMIEDVVADEVGKLNDEVQKHPDLVKRNMSFKSYIFEKPIDNGNVKIYCCYSRRDGSQMKRIVSNLLILDLKHCYDRKTKFVTYVSGTSFHEDDTVYYSENSSNHMTTEVSAYLIQNSLSITNVSRFGDFLYREIEARMERY